MKLKTPQKDQKPTLASILQTKNKEQQVSAVQGLIQLAKTPVVDIVVRYDGRSEQVGLTIIGIEQVTTEAIYKILDMAREQVRQNELQQAAQQAQHAAQAPGTGGPESDGDTGPQTDETAE